MRVNSLLKKYSLTAIFCFSCFIGNTESSQSLLDKGWKALVQDNDTLAVKYFELAFESAQKENNTEDIANALLHLGICYYGVNSDKGLDYANQALTNYQTLETSHPKIALIGKSKCFQLISTIYSRQGNYTKALELSKNALSGIIQTNEKGYKGLIYTSLGKCYTVLNKTDSSEFYYRLALFEQLQEKNYAYLPTALVNVAEIELKHGNSALSLQLFNRGLKTADSTNNKQAQVNCLLGKGNWFIANVKKDSANFVFNKALALSESLSDKSFRVKALEQLVKFEKENGNFKIALNYQEEMTLINDSMDAHDKLKGAKLLEVQFEVAEKDRKLELLNKEKNIVQLSNYILWGSIVFLIILSLGVILFLKRLNQRDKQLLKTKEELIVAVEEQRKIKEQFLQNELEFKESQLSAMAVQILQKNELMHELKQQLEKNNNQEADFALTKLINKGFNHDKEWDDFNQYFESVNRNFYSRLKTAYPEISPNDLKICALIKLNLSSKDMSGILNISPDSVKTARYRLRKKLQMSPEENLVDFIQKL